MCSLNGAEQKERGRRGGWSPGALGHSLLRDWTVEALPSLLLWSRVGCEHTETGVTIRLEFARVVRLCRNFFRINLAEYLILGT
jgi:hypothetical protein